MLPVVCPKDGTACLESIAAYLPSILASVRDLKREVLDDRNWSKQAVGNILFTIRRYCETSCKWLT